MSATASLVWSRVPESLVRASVPGDCVGKSGSGLMWIGCQSANVPLQASIRRLQAPLLASPAEAVPKILQGSSSGGCLADGGGSGHFDASRIQPKRFPGHQKIGSPSPLDQPEKYSLSHWKSLHWTPHRSVTCLWDAGRGYSQQQRT